MKAFRLSFHLLVILTALTATLAGADGASNELSVALGFVRIQGGYNTIGALGLGYHGVDYSHTLTDWLALSGRARVSVSANTDQTQGNTIVELTVGPTFNFPVSPAHGLADAFFVSLEAGVNYTQVNGITVPGTLYATGPLFQTNPAFSIEVGKRFQVLPNVSLMPSLLVTVMDGPDVISGAANSNAALSIEPLAVSVTF